jgi:hypothetical protein
MQALGAISQRRRERRDICVFLTIYSLVASETMFPFLPLLLTETQLIYGVSHSPEFNYFSEPGGN